MGRRVDASLPLDVTWVDTRSRAFVFLDLSFPLAPSPLFSCSLIRLHHAYPLDCCYRCPRIRINSFIIRVSRSSSSTSPCSRLCSVFFLSICCGSHFHHFFFSFLYLALPSQSICMSSNEVCALIHLSYSSLRIMRPLSFRQTGLDSGHGSVYRSGCSDP